MRHNGVLLTANYVQLLQVVTLLVHLTPLIFLLWMHKKRFMHNVILTAKGRNCVREEHESLDTQKVYAAFLDTYHDHLSTKLKSTKLCLELTWMKLDDRRYKSFASFLHFSTAKNQDPAGIEHKSVDDETKRFWLTNIFSYREDKDAAVRQAITTEVTINDTKGSSTTASISLTKFYNSIVLSNLGQRHATNRANRNNG